MVGLGHAEVVGADHAVGRPGQAHHRREPGQGAHIAVVDAIRRQQQPAQEEEEQIVRKLRQKHREHHSAEAVYGTVGAVHEAPVHELPAADGRIAHLQAPAREGVDEK